MKKPRKIPVQRATLSGKTWGKPTVDRDVVHTFENATFQAYQFDTGLARRGGRDAYAPSAAAYGLCTGDKSLGRFVERLLTDCSGLILTQQEAGAGWPW